jgi:membrane protease subunit (stomatin/prohibitin family)
MTGDNINSGKSTDAAESSKTGAANQSNGKAEGIKEEKGTGTAQQATAAQTQAQPPDQAAKKDDVNKAPMVKTERPANCEGCKKSIKKKRWYYRNGKYYCTKRCWASSTKKAAKPEEAAPAS